MTLYELGKKNAHSDSVGLSRRHPWDYPKVLAECISKISFQRETQKMPVEYARGLCDGMLEELMKCVNCKKCK